ncbi:hypothetical protein [Vibrio parahaemolyticus]|uniref:hypothetical protein n=1 Tax=Vibrio parahaemolyticus TaxID=670 RepID=UPI0007A01F1A|nr:hypothetical protein [Vibrio parahaemolyticus]EGQ7739681.1 hypothetical protein [Vibrio parahaemolyticus]EGQ8179221.1 hypothetical protein [Vibrio parahaemolyticus]EJG1398322.1 hypothetical protein [Vibrio parahaemolyticus]KYX74541.1 hypothetical protein AU403_03255 [Vibrio parahaemolyticus]KYZ30458.1 hypothetical protein AW041_18570 [Vibrio parahaemolyticus]
MTKRVLTCIASGVIALASPTSWACSYDGLFANPFSESYPGALDVSIATQLAIRSQSMKPLELIEGEAGLRRASWWLNLMVKANPDLSAGSYVYVVDRQLWSRISESDHSIEVHVSPTTESAQVLQISEAALHNLISEQITIDQARELGVVKET